MSRAVNLDPFATVAGQIEVGGVTHDVLHLNGREYRILNAGDGGSVLDCFAIARRIVPSLGDGVYELTGAQIGAIIRVADGQVKDVEALFPNSPGPTPPNENAAPAPVS